MKVTLAGVCSATIDAMHPEPVSLKVLHDACLAAGLVVQEAQVYAGVQSMASTGKCGRGQERRTWCRLEVGRDPVQPARNVEGRPARVKKGAAFYSTESVLDDIETLLGPSSPRPLNKTYYAFMIDNTADAAYILERAQMVIRKAPESWCQYMQAEVTVVGFFI